MSGSSSGPKLGYTIEESIVKFKPDDRRLDERGTCTIIPTLFVTDKVQKQTDGLIEDLIDAWMDE